MKSRVQYRSVIRVQTRSVKSRKIRVQYRSEHTTWNRGHLVEVLFRSAEVLLTRTPKSMKAGDFLLFEASEDWQHAGHFWRVHPSDLTGRRIRQ